MKPDNNSPASPNSENQQNLECIRNPATNKESNSRGNESSESVVKSTVKAVTLLNINNRRKVRRHRLTEDELQALRVAYLAYIEETTIPIINDFAWRMRLNKQVFYDHPILKELTDLANQKKCAYYELGMVTGKLDTAGCIFALKQHGWKDRQEVETVIIDKKKQLKEMERLFE